MCYAKPGPRCSNHARMRMDRLHKEFREISDKYNDLIVNDVVPPDEVFNDLLTKNKAYSEAREVYYSTPAGFKELENIMAAAPADSVEYARASRQLSMGQQLRERQFALYHAGKHKGEIPHQYVADEEDMEQLVNNLRTGYGEENVYVGRASTVPESLSEQQSRKYAVLQKRCDTLIDCFRRKNGDFNIDVDITVQYEKHGLTPGFKHVGSGSFSAAYLDEKTGYIIKIPAHYNADETDNGREGFPVVDSEQESFAVIDVDSLKNDNVEYVETLFYNDSRGDKINAVVQPYLNDYNYVSKLDLPVKEQIDIEKKLQQVSKSPGLWDLHEGNYRVHKETGKIVLFDCLDPKL